MKRFFLLLSLAIISVSAFAQDKNKEQSKENDPLDISAELQKVSDLGILTVETVALKKEKADILYVEEQWSDAIDAYLDFARDANWLSNIIAQCLEPFYSASYDDRKNVSLTFLNKWRPYENTANDYKRQRNRAYIRVGLCFKKLGDIEKAVAYLYKGLDLVDMKSSEDWNAAVEALTEIVGYSPTSK